MTPARIAAMAGVAGLLLLAGASIVADFRRPPAEEALAAARAHLDAGREAEAAAIARDVLAREPVHGPAFGVLARALAGQGGADADFARYDIAARRAPRDVHVRGWMAARHLEAGRFAEALAHIEALLVISADSRAQVLPVVAGLAADQGFADALADYLVARPQWRSAILRASLRAEPPAGDHLHAALRARGALPQADAARWIDGMLGAGRWGSAYAYWISAFGAQLPDSLPLLHNGDFSRPISAQGFDWRLRRTAGVVGNRVQAAEGGHVLRLSFPGGRVGRTGLEQPLLLAPGPYRLDLRARTDGLNSYRGLEWQLTCSDNRTRIASGAQIRAMTAWTGLSLEFEVPPANCEGQWLRLVNPAPAGAAQALRGELHLADVSITRL